MNVVQTLNAAQIEELHTMYRGEWWTRDRTLDDTINCVENSSLVFGCVEDEKLVAFARVLTDFVFKAMVYDVIVARGQRGKGIGTHLVTRILDHPRLRRVKHVELYCQPDRISFYGKFDFTQDIGSIQLMRYKRH